MRKRQQKIKQCFGSRLLYGLPTGVQNSVIGLANVILQSNVNSFGQDAMAGYGSYVKIASVLACCTPSLTTSVSWLNIRIKTGAAAKMSNVNSFGQDAMAGYGSYVKIEGFAFLPITCFSMAMTTFIGQNLGAGKHERAREGARFGIAMSLVLADFIIVFVCCYALIS